jgi:hypothetical protein
MPIGVGTNEIDAGAASTQGRRRRVVSLSLNFGCGWETGVVSRDANDLPTDEADSETHQHPAVPALVSEGLVVHSARKSVDLGNVFDLPFPCCPATEADMCIGPHVDGAVEASGRHHEQATVRLDGRNCRPTVTAEALLMPTRWKSVSLYEILAGYPCDLCRRREQVSRMG